MNKVTSLTYVCLLIELSTHKFGDKLESPKEDALGADFFSGFHFWQYLAELYCSEIFQSADAASFIL